MTEFELLMFFGRPWVWAAQKYKAARDRGSVTQAFWLALYLPIDFMYRPHLDHARRKRGANV